MQKLIRFVVLMLLPIATIASAGTAKNVAYVDVQCGTSGSDNAKINDALAQARALRPTNSAETIVVRLLGGICRLDHPILLTQTDSGTPTHPSVFEGTHGAVITGAFPLQQSTGATMFELLPDQAKQAAVEYKLSDRAARDFAAEPPRGGFYPDRVAAIMLVQGDQWLQLAHWPNKGYAHASADPIQKGPVVTPAFRVPHKKAALWAQETALRLAGYWTYDWAYETLRGAVVPSGDIMKAAAPLTTTYPENPTLYYAVLNDASELDQPGEYVINTDSGEATVWPYPGTATESVETSTLLEVRGAHDVRIDHLAFRGALDTAILVENSDRIVITNSWVAIAGKIGIGINGGQNDAIERTVISDIGETGVVLKGGDRATLKPGGHALTDSVVTRYGVLTRTYRPAVSINGVGLRVEGSLLEDGPFGAVIIAGNDNIIRNNEIAHVVREAGDAGAVYSGRNLSWRGNIIQGNYFHDIMPDIGPGKTPRGVYLDDYLSGNSVKDNVFYKVGNPVYIHGGSDNAITHNFFACVTPDAIFKHNESEAAWKNGGLSLPLVDAARRAGIPAGSLPLYLSRYPDMDRGLSPEGYIAKNDRTTGNVVAGNADFENWGPVTEPFDPPRHIPDLSCDVREAQQSDYVATAAAKFGFVLADRRAALRAIPYYSAAMPQ